MGIESIPTSEELTKEEPEEWKEAFPKPEGLTGGALDFYVLSLRLHLDLYGSRDVVPFNGCTKDLNYNERFLLINRLNIYERALKFQRNPAVVVV
ncbi:hypothetical protein HYV88_00860 [Candidatus Woesearchaeota archaeon]|nr:hypothetical protein [Candidatus Woesearchaeota archaeon]